MSWSKAPYPNYDWPKAPNPTYDWPLMDQPRSISARRRYLGIVYFAYKTDCLELDEI